MTAQVLTPDDLAELNGKVSGLLGSVASVIAELDQINARLALLENAPPVEPPVVEPPVVEPPVVEPPVVEPPLDGEVIEHRRFTPALSRLVVFSEYHQSSRYERLERVTIVTDPSAHLKFWACNLAGGGEVLKMKAAEYRLKIDGSVKASTTLTTAANGGEFVFPTAGLRGWKECIIECDAEDVASLTPHWVHFGSEKVDNWMPVWTGSYDLTHGSLEYLSFKIPARFTPKAVPLAARQIVPFSDAISYTQMHRTNLVPGREGNIFRPNLTGDVMGTGNTQSYFYQDLVRKLPTLPLLDGPRGVGSVGMITHGFVDRHGGLYFAHSWGIGRASPEGEIRHRAGYVHEGVFSHDNSTLKLLGNWDSIPVERRGFHELWGIAVDAESTMTDPNAAPIGGEQPHPGRVRFFVPDSQNGRICEVSFPGNDKDAEPTVSEFIVGLLDPWDIVCVGKVLYISERKAHRIVMYDKDTAEFLGVLVSGAAFAIVDENRFVRRTADLGAIRAQKCVAPEGLFYQDGWLYYGSKAQGQVRKINLASPTDNPVVVCEPKIDDNSNFVKIALSDGTFGPRGVIATWTWSNANFGLPEIFRPDGTKWSWNSYASELTCGRGGLWQTLGYGSAGCFGNGRFYIGSSEEGIAMITQVLPTDPTPNVAQYKRGRDAYNAKGYKLTHGEDGFGFLGLPLPWGESADIDYYLAWNGHTKEVVPA